MTTDEKKCTKNPQTCGFWRECEEYINSIPDDTRTRKVMKCVAADIPEMIVYGTEVLRGGRNARKLSPDNLL